MVNVMNEIKTRFDRDGVVVIRDVVPRDAIIALREALGLVLKKYEASSSHDDHAPVSWHDASLHQALIGLRERDRFAFSALYDSMQTSTALYRVTTAPPLAAAAAMLLNDEGCLSQTGNSLRMDAPGDRRNALDWHQDCSYFEQNRNGCNGSVCWVPLHNLTLEHGPVMVCPGSHALGRIQPRSSAAEPGRSSQQHRVPDDVVSRFEHRPVIARAGDAAFMHMDTIHRSGVNTSDEIRFTALVRFHRILAEDFVPGLLAYQPNVHVRQQVMEAVR
jgi:ectoine hydroxylase-related dioxygenase (phytanoyl-CoA dioxygenase family)